MSDGRIQEGVILLSAQKWEEFPRPGHKWRRYYKSVRATAHEKLKRRKH